MKKGYIYLVDVIFAIMIILIGTVFLYYKFSLPPEHVFITEQLSEDIIGVLFYTKIDDLCINPGEAGCDCPSYSNLTEIVCNSNLYDYETNLLSMISEIIETGSIDGETTQNL
ncbi:hypothetical protein GF327_08330, partial [Candidatus Woesearchaeota archaeon]|nr:hypothetical protein [Candidatus Woesearchaeota archaeon]